MSALAQMSVKQESISILAKIKAGPHKIKTWHNPRYLYPGQKIISSNTTSIYPVLHTSILDLIGPPVNAFLLKFSNSKNFTCKLCLTLSLIQCWQHWHTPLSIAEKIKWLPIVNPLQVKYKKCNSNRFFLNLFSINVSYWIQPY